MHYNIPPSMFAFHECDRCFWLERKGKVSKPYMPFPSVFSKMDKLQKKFTEDKDLKRIDPTLPAGRFLKGYSEYVTSKPLTFGNVSVAINGKLDSLAQLKNSYGVFDLKTTDPSNEVKAKYLTQLACYAFALEHPAKATPITPVDTVGLLCFRPAGMARDKKKRIYQVMKLTSYITKPDYGLMMDKLRYFANILDMENPPATNQDCKTCKRHNDCNGKGW